MITSDDIARSASAQVKPDATIAKMSDAQIEQSIDLLLEGFNAESNSIDRRIFYEATGRQLVEGEFDNELDSSDEDWANFNKPDPLSHYINYIYN